MTYFSKAYSSFFKELSKNNSKEWFDANRKTYEIEVKDPFKNLIQDILDQIPDIDQDIAMTPKDAIFRINRDIRFSKDKTPYNTIMKAGFAKGGRKSPYAGYYLGIDAEYIHIGGGAFGLDKELLTKVRDEIVAHTNEFLSLTEGKVFSTMFGEIMGDRIKRIPTQYQETYEKTALVANKQFYYMTKLDTKSLLTSDKLLDTIMENFRIVAPLNSFLKRAIS